MNVKVLIASVFIPASVAFAIDAPPIAANIPLNQENLLSSAAGTVNRSLPTPSVIKGWGYMFGKLEEAGVKRSTLVEIFSHPRMPIRDNLYFSLQPKESAYNYRKLNNLTARKNAVSFYRAHAGSFAAAEREFGVPRSVILAILQVETYCGKNTGKSPVLPGLIRLASAADPENIRKNFQAHQSRGSKATLQEVVKRAVWLERTFFSHIVGAIKLAQQKGIHPMELKGSFAGAIGLPQFLPGHHYNFGIDGNRDGRVDLFDPKDAIPSIANYLQSHGWNKPALSLRERRAVIAEYNRSVPYVDTVLAMARDLEPMIAPAAPSDRVKNGGSAKRK